jgi:hypothetical protein
MSAADVRLSAIRQFWCQLRGCSAGARPAGLGIELHSTFRDEHFLSGKQFMLPLGAEPGSSSDQLAFFANLAYALLKSALIKII